MTPLTPGRQSGGSATPHFGLVCSDQDDAGDWGVAADGKLLRPHSLQVGTGGITSAGPIIGGGGSGPQILPIVLITAANSPYAIASADYTVAVSTTGGAVIVTLPQAALVLGRVLNIAKRTTDANTVTITPFAGDTIGGGANAVLSVQSSLMLQSTGLTDWVII